VADEDLEAKTAPGGEECTNHHLLQRAKTRNCGYCKHKTAQDNKTTRVQAGIEPLPSTQSRRLRHLHSESTI
jgi:hypothetical protein